MKMGHDLRRMLVAAEVRGIERYAIDDGIAGRHRELPSTEPVLILNTGDPISVIDASGDELAVETGKAFFAGLHDRHCFSVSNGRQSGIHVRLSSAAAYRLLGPAAGECANRAVLLDDILGHREAGKLQVADPDIDLTTFGAAIGAMLAQRNPESGLVGIAVRELARPGARVANVAEMLDISRKTLSKRFTAWTGLAPVTFVRIARFERLLASSNGLDWAERALAAGYYDQSHMIRDFRQFAGQSPLAHTA